MSGFACSGARPSGWRPVWIMKRAYKYLFGPVPSRRLGRSLGVDLTPFKTCTFNCVYCQLGRTTAQTLERRDYVPVAAVEAELDAWLAAGGTADHITLAGSGEPTLHRGFGTVLQAIRARTAIPSVLLSNGTLFWQPEVREAAGLADIVKVTLSAWDASSFAQVHRPHADLDFQRILEGQRAFREGFSGRLWVEVFLLPGINSGRPDVERIAALVNRLKADEIHLNTAVRPPAEACARVMPREALEAVATLFRPVAHVIAEFSAEASPEVAINEATILALLERRPCTEAQLAAVFGLHLNEVAKYVGKLERMGKIGRSAEYPEAYCVVRGNPGESACNE